MRGVIGGIKLKKEQEQAVIAPLTADPYFFFSSSLEKGFFGVELLITSLK